MNEREGDSNAKTSKGQQPTTEETQFKSSGQKKKKKKKSSYRWLNKSTLVYQLLVQHLHQIDLL